LRRLGGIGLEVVEVHPGQIVAFLAHRQGNRVVGLDQKPQVVVVMGGGVGPGRDAVDVEVKETGLG